MTAPTSTQDGTAVAAVLAFARAQIGKPYVFGASGPDSYDCSGLTQAAYNAAGVHLTHSTYTQILEGIADVPESGLAPGDLVFPDAGHVQIYSGNGNIIEAPHTGAFVREVPMWGFWKARRIVNGGQAVSGGATPTLFGLPDPLTVAKQVFDLLTWPEKLAAHLADGKFVRRIGLGVLGVVFIGAGLFVMLKATGYLDKKEQEASKVAEIAGVFA
jgi:NlpC/P60 family